MIKGVGKMKIKIVLDIESDELLYSCHFLDETGIRREFILSPREFINDSKITIAKIHQLAS